MNKPMGSVLSFLIGGCLSVLFYLIGSEFGLAVQIVAMGTVLAIVTALLIRGLR
jgi:VIT1/CCC1 family predicted Fe2+/Mn2+ transporter